MMYNTFDGLAMAWLGTSHVMNLILCATSKIIKKDGQLKKWVSTLATRLEKRRLGEKEMLRRAP